MDSMQLLFVFALKVWLSNAGEGQCQFTVKGQDYNVESLQSSSDYAATSKEYNYVLNFCGHSTHSDCPGAACQYQHNKMMAVLGKFKDTTTPPTWQLLDDSDPSAGLTLTYSNGDSCAGAKRPRCMTVHLPCTPGVDKRELQVTTDTGFSCALPGYVFNLPTCASCPEGCEDVGMSRGSVFVILFLLSLAAYLGVGCWYNHKNYQTSYGLESVPNLEFWQTIPGLVQDGVIYSYKQSSLLLAKAQESSNQHSYSGKPEGRPENQGLLSEDQDHDIGASGATTEARST